jgi:PadR family transcriptional regulator, regulatory protein AphA
MDIQFTILGLLSWQSLSGYDIKKIISESDVFYWSGNNNQIYNNLITMHKADLISKEVRHQESLPSKKIYSITETGREKMQSWLLSDPELPETHHHFLIQLAWADMLSAGQLDDLLARYEEGVGVQLRMRQLQMNEPAVAPNRTPRESFLWRMIYEHSAAIYRHELDWVRLVRVGLHEKRLIDS